MPAFRYTAGTRGGETRDGVREAESREAVVRWLQDQDLVPIAVERSGGETAARRGVAAAKPLPPARHLAMVRELATLVEADLPLEDALALIADLTRQAREKALIAGLLASLRAGQPLSVGMQASGAFPADQLALVKAGEASGALGEVLVRMARTLERAHALRERVRSALIYPTILTCAAVGSVLVLLTVVVPTFEPLFADAGRSLPPATRMLLDVAHGVQVAALPGSALVAVLLLAWRHAQRSPGMAARLDGLVLRIPVAGPLAAALDAARFSRSLGTLLGNGVALLPALDIARAAMSNRKLASAIAEATDHLRAGGRLGERLLALRAWPRLSAELVRVGEETGRLPAMLIRAAEILDEDTGRALERLAALITPMVTLLLGGVVAGIVVALLSAVLAVNDVAL